MARVNGKLDEFAGVSGAAAVVLETENGQVEISTELLANLGAEVDRAREKKERMEEATGQTTDAEEELAGQSEITADEIAGVGDAAEDAAGQIDEMKDAFNELFGIQMSVDRATINYHQTMDDLIAELEDGALKLDAQSEAGRANRGAVLDQIDAINDLRDANIDAGMGVDEANEKYLQQI